MRAPDFSARIPSKTNAPYHRDTRAHAGVHFFTLLAAILCATNPGVAHAEIHSLIANPAEDCSTQMNVGWQADLTDTNCAVRYTPATDTNWEHARQSRAQPERCDLFDGINSKTPTGADWKEEAKFLKYSVTLNGLTPNTRYMYQVQSGAIPAPGETNHLAKPAESAAHYFKTAGAADFSFVWISDIHAYTPIPNRMKNASAVLAAAMKIDPEVSFVFATGDVVAWGASYSFWKNLFDQPFARNYMFATVIGNHDWMERGGGGTSDYFHAALHNPTNGYAGQESVSYWFIYGDVLFLLFNNELLKKSPQEEETAKAWAAGVIAKQKGKYRRIFIAEHYQWFDGRTGKANWYDHWKDFCDQYGVTLALSGNNHIYERTLPLRADQVVPAGEGTVYMEAPSSDGDRGVEAGQLTLNTNKLAFTYSSHERTNPSEVKTIGCVLVHVSPDTITTRLVYLDETRATQVADTAQIKSINH